MTPQELIPIIISVISLLISIITAYKTLFANFSGKVWMGNYVVLNNINNIPSITLNAFLENTGTKLGVLDDLRVIVEHRETGATYKFFPLVTRDNYSIFKTYNGEEWFAFSGIVLSPGSRIQKYILFRAMIDNFEAQKGHFKISIQSRWYGKNKWETLPFPLPFELDETTAKQWNNKEVLQVASDNIQAFR